jgi:hypothetical protein
MEAPGSSGVRLRRVIRSGCPRSADAASRYAVGYGRSAAIYAALGRSGYASLASALARIAVVSTHTKAITKLVKEPLLVAIDMTCEFTICCNLLRGRDISLNFRV